MYAFHVAQHFDMTNQAHTAKAVVETFT